MVARHNAMTQNHDAVRHREGVQHVVRDDDDRNSLFSDTVDECETPAGLFDAKRRKLIWIAYLLVVLLFFFLQWVYVQVTSESQPEETGGSGIDTAPPAEPEPPAPSGGSLSRLGLQRSDLGETLSRAEAYLITGRATEAQILFQNLLERSDADPMTRFLATLGKAHALAYDGRTQAALATLKNDPALMESVPEVWQQSAHLLARPSSEE